VKPAIHYGLALAGVAALVFAARHLDVHALTASLRAMNPLLGLTAMLAMIVGKVGAKALRSQRLLVVECARAGCAPPSLPTTARLLAASHAAGQLAWGPLGFTVRTVALKASGMPLVAIARVHIAERIAEALGIAAVALVALAFAPAAILGSWLGRIMVAGFVLIAVAAVVVAATPRLRTKLAARVPAGKALAVATLWAFASSLADIAVLYLASRAMHVEVGIAPLLLAFLAVNGACALPLTPAQLGVQEAAITVAFATAGIPAPAALACALAYRCAHLVPLALVGVPSLIATWAPARASRDHRRGDLAHRLPGGSRHRAGSDVIYLWGGRRSAGAFRPSSGRAVWSTRASSQSARSSASDLAATCSSDS
jgi:uncharacterized membrane protein YbhN (UPF0104 family)